MSEKRPLVGIPAKLPVPGVLAIKGTKHGRPGKMSRGPRHSLLKCIYQPWKLYTIAEAMTVENYIQPIFPSGVGQSVPIAIKFKLDV